MEKLIISDCEEEENLKRFCNALLGKTIVNINYGEWPCIMSVKFTDDTEFVISSDSEDGSDWLEMEYRK